jgi:hypothetical protein
LAPTRAPTRTPTNGPTLQTTPIVSFASNLTVGGSTEATLNAAGQLAVLNATADSMGIPMDTVHIDGQSSIAENRRLEESQSLRRLTTSWTIIVTTRVEIPLGITSYTNSSQLYASITKMIETAVSSGAFTRKLVAAAEAYNAPGLLSANVTEVSNGAVSVDNTLDSEDSSDDDFLYGFNLYASIGIIVGAAVFLVLLCAAVWYFALGVHNKVGVVQNTRITPVA